ncbi:D-2-hydroxyacid dehydrogenase [Bacillus sp. Marseille-P3661]|uniref:D-2-hydroxyacid dehydrogenase n=1 Tax=Bacillus sp. Marseille-P3661 TaxID=1936234 RepID=UPI000C8293E5|nr:D-2-hydroxyacid dehydrogenase [Bacillus sp. Marseille-P3661]
MEIINILVAGPYEEDFQKQLPTSIHPNFRFVAIEEITEGDLAWADAYVGFEPAPQFDLSQLKWIHSFNAGVNNYLALNGWEENDVLLTRTVCSFGERISEYCLSYVLKDLQYQKYFETRQQEKKWIQRTPKMVKDQTIVVFGTGEIGQVLARSFSLLGATVMGVSKSGTSKDYFHKVIPTSAASSVLPIADWVISTLPLTKETNGIFNSKLFSYFNSAAFINVGRGATVDETALMEALNTGKVRQAVLDVFSTEPLLEDSPLWEREDVIITPHISAVTELDEAVACFIDTLKKVEQNEDLHNRVDIEKGY